MENYNSEEQVFETTGQEEAKDLEKRTKKKNKKKRGKKEQKLTLAMVAIVTAFVVFIVLVVIQDRIVNEGVTRNVVVAIKDIPAGTKLTQENMPNYMRLEARAEEQLPVSGTFSSGYELIDKVTDRDIQAKELITSDCLYQVDFFDEVQDPVEISIPVGDLGRAVAGTLRAGDLIDIKTVIKVSMNEENTEGQGSVSNVGSVTEEPVVGLETPQERGEGSEAPVVSITKQEDAVILDMSGNVLVNPNLNLTYGVTGEYAVQTIAEKVRVVAVYTSGGESTQQVEGAGGTMIATVINVVVPRSLQDSIYLAMAEGNIQLSRIEVKEVAEQEANQ